MALSGMVAARTPQSLAGKPKPNADWADLEDSEDMAEIVVIAAHPQLDPSRVTRTMMEATARLDPSRVNVRDLYALYPDCFIDVQAEQAALKQARLVVWLHPVHGYSMPPLMKLWLDEVFSFGWASTGGPQSSYRPDGYNRYFFDAFLHPHEQTAALCGMRWLPPNALHGAHHVQTQALADLVRAG